MNESTARNRLHKDILWSFIVKTGQDVCCKCGLKMDRGTFSVEHVTPWLDSSDPISLFFDLDNISFSHLTCNISDARRSNKKYSSKEEKNLAKAERNKKVWQKLTKEEQQELRRSKYEKYGC